VQGKEENAGSTIIQKPYVLPAVLQQHYQALMSIRSFCPSKRGRNGFFVVGIEPFTFILDVIEKLSAIHFFRFFINPVFHLPYFNLHRRNMLFILLHKAPP
jgi:hypothetical protein